VFDLINETCMLMNVLSKWQIILDVTSDMAALEVGGGPWFNTWKGKTSTPPVLSRAIGLPVDVDGIYNLFPLFKPPGL
jgi:tocopherol cyclase